MRPLSADAKSQELFASEYAEAEASWLKQQGLSDEVRSGVQNFRRASWRQFGTLGLPTRQLADWHYCDMASAMAKPAPRDELTNIDADDFCARAKAIEMSSILVFVDGVFSSERSRIGSSEGITIGPLSQVWRGVFPGLSAKQALTVIQGAQVVEPDAMTFLGQSFLREGMAIRVSARRRAPGLIQLVHISTGAATSRHLTNLLWLEEGSAATVIESWFGDTQSAGLNSGITVAQVGSSAHLNLYRVQAQSRNSLHYGRLICEQLRDSYFSGVSLALGGRVARETWNVSQTGPGATTRLYGLSLLRGSQTVDQRTVIRHLAPDGASEQLFKGIVADTARSAFTGKIYIAQDAQRVGSSQLNHNLLVGQQAEADTRPELEIYADDVKAAHGATVGQMDPEEIFYLQSRGIGRAAAIKMLSEGYVREVVSHIEDESARALIGESIEHVLGLFSFDQGEI